MKPQQLERRDFLGLAAALVVRPPGGLHLAATDGDESLDYEQFLAEAVPAAHALVGDTSRVGEDRYLHVLASFAVRLRDVPPPEMKQTSVGDGPRTWLGANDGGDPFTVLHWRMEPGATISQHVHAYGNVVTLGLEGEVRIRNYEMVDDVGFDHTGPFPMRKCVEQVLRPGDINLVRVSNGFTHGFVAGPHGARGLDLTTRIRPKLAVPTIDISATPVDEAAALYEARWRFE